MNSSLPIDAVLPEILATLANAPVVLVQAPPGAGKTTRVPPALLGAPWRRDRRILMLEPRRLAARSAARFMARALGEAAGETVGYRTRLDSRVSKSTRIEVVTEGILTRMIQDDPALGAYAAVLFDEFHERSLNADLGLALVRESQQALREDLRIVVMSATLDTEPLARLLDDAPVISATGRSFPVDVSYRPPPRERRLLDHVAATAGKAVAEHGGSVLVFAPGAGEIRRLESLLDGALPEEVRLAPLYGNLSGAAQDAAIAPAPEGQRKLVLATDIAESSLTIEGVRVVIDAGRQRRAVFDPSSGLTRLVTTRISKSSADQRAGRAGRIEPGVCFRLWSESEHKSLPAFTPPEILEADLAPLVLELARWGARDPAALVWLDPPPKAHWDQAVELLQWLDALDDGGHISAHGEAMRTLGLHPRLAHMVLHGRRLGLGRLAAELAALLSERDILGARAGSDMDLRIRVVRGELDHPAADRGRLEAVRRLAGSLAGKMPAWQRRPTAQTRLDAGDGPAADSRPDGVGRLLALAYPDRIAGRRPGSAPRYRLSNGRGAFLFDDDPLAREEWLVAAELDGQAREARIFLAAPVSPSSLEEDLAAHITESDSVGWDEDRGRVVARRQRKLGQLVLEETQLPAPDPARVHEGLVEAVRARGLESLRWTEKARQWAARVQLLHELGPEDWPACDGETLMATLDHWLGPFLAGKRRWDEVEKMDLLPALESMLDFRRRKTLGRLAPESLTVPTGQRIRLDYTAESGPVLAVKLQALFGWKETPRIADGRVPVVCHLLSPAGRPLAVTGDLESFWKNAYVQVRKDMRGRYPKHPWPEDPLTAPPQKGTRRQGN